MTSLSSSCSHTLQFYGERCRVIELQVNGLATIAAKQKVFFFPPLVLVPQDDLSTLPWTNPLPKADDLKALNDYLKQNPNNVCTSLFPGHSHIYARHTNGYALLVKVVIPESLSCDISYTCSVGDLYQAIFVEQQY